MDRLFLWQSKLRRFHWCLLALIPLAIFVTVLQLGGFRRTYLSIRRACTLAIEYTQNPTPKLEQAQARLQAAVKPSITTPLKDPRIVITKSVRRADLYSGDKLIKSYKFVLGGSPEGHKARRGDGRTPEGQYRICTRLKRSKFHLFLGLNYPNEHDGEEGLKRQVITKDDALRIAESERKQQKPPWDTPLSGAIGLHGGGTDSDWTLGCIAFDNRDIDEIWVATQHWTPVEIRP